MLCLLRRRKPSILEKMQFVFPALPCPWLRDMSQCQLKTGMSFLYCYPIFYSSETQFPIPVGSYKDTLYLQIPNNYTTYRWEWRYVIRASSTDHVLACMCVLTCCTNSGNEGTTRIILSEAEAPNQCNQAVLAGGGGNHCKGVLLNAGYKGLSLQNILLKINLQIAQIIHGQILASFLDCKDKIIVNRKSRLSTKEQKLNWSYFFSVTLKTT